MNFVFKFTNNGFLKFAVKVYQYDEHIIYDIPIQRILYNFNGRNCEFVLFFREKKPRSFLTKNVSLTDDTNLPKNYIIKLLFYPLET